MIIYWVVLISSLFNCFAILQGEANSCYMKSWNEERMKEKRNGKGLEGCLSGQKDYPFGLFGDAWGTLIWLHICSDPWTEQPGGLQSMGWQTVRHNRVTITLVFAVIHTIHLLTLTATPYSIPKPHPVLHPKLHSILKPRWGLRIT